MSTSISKARNGLYRKCVRMEKKIFVLGFPGSGKSTGARLIEGIARDLQWFPTRFSDYDILQKMYKGDDGLKFSSASADRGGFDVHDHKMFDIALQRLERQVHKKQHAKGKKELAIIEFARNDYRRAFKLFSPRFLQDSSFLFLDAEVETCIERIRRRTDNPTCIDDHFVSEYIFETYYHKDDRQEALTMLKDFYGIDSRAATIISNPAQKSPQAFCDEVEAWIASTLQKQNSTQKVALV